ncbi:MAG TPA: class I SAM-dependent methyltransferase [Pyrinomonadaceae bacterium]|nr:class I SAM-dependent methyltransferase [Pyrinomonadaceae bacterium]
MTLEAGNIEERRCPACGNAGRRRRGLKNDFELMTCEACATLYTAYAPGGSQSHDYDAYYTADNLTVPEFIDRRLDEIVTTFEEYRKNNRILDVGCGAGSFLEAAARNNWEAFGVEVSSTASEHIRNRGYDVFCGELQNAGYPDGHFDVVIASEVLEHVPNPRAMLEEISRVLRPGGLLWATTPHGRGVSGRVLGLGWSTVCPPEHLQLFSVASISRLLTETGFEHIKLATHGTNPFELIHGLRRRVARTPQVDGGSTPDSFNRVESSYELNEFLSDKPARRLVKGLLNEILNVTRMGDSLKIRAEKVRS